MDVAGYVQSFNEGVQTGQWEPLTRYFADDAVMVFEPPVIEPVKGKASIRHAYTERPPTDTIELAGEPVQDGATLVAPYRWARSHESGWLRFQTADDLITHLVITFD